MLFSIDILTRDRLIKVVEYINASFLYYLKLCWPIKCRWCNSSEVIKWGFYTRHYWWNAKKSWEYRFQRYRCKPCSKTFTLLTNTPFAHGKIPPALLFWAFVQYFGNFSPNLRQLAIMLSTSLPSICRWLKTLRAQAAYGISLGVTKQPQTPSEEMNEIQGDEIYLKSRRRYSGRRRTEKLIVEVAWYQPAKRAYVEIQSHFRRDTAEGFMDRFFERIVNRPFQISTDGSPCYDFLSSWGILHDKVIHHKEWVSETGTHINGAEGVQNLLESFIARKRGFYSVEATRHALMVKGLFLSQPPEQIVLMSLLAGGMLQTHQQTS